MFDSLTKSRRAKRRLLGISVELAKSYLRENLHFTLGAQERAGLRRFYELCVAHGLAPSGLEGALKAVGEAGVCWR